MLKKYAYLLLMAIFASVLFTACDEDDNPLVSDDQIVISSVSFGGNQGIFAMAGDAVQVDGSYFGNTTGSIELTSETPGGQTQALTADNWQDTQIEFTLPAALEDGAYSVKITRVNPAEDEEFHFIVGEADDAIGAITAISMSATSVKLAWPANEYEGNDNLFSNYVVEYEDATGNTVSEESNTSQPTLDGLPANTSIQFSVWAVFADGSTSDTTMKTWAGADRLPISPGEPVMLYSSSSSEFGSGLDVWDEDFEMDAVAIKIANSNRWNYGLDTKTPGEVIFGSAANLSYDYKGNTPENNGLLAYDPETGDLAAYYAGSLDEWPSGASNLSTDLSLLTYTDAVFDLSDPSNFNSDLLKTRGGMVFIGRVPNGTNGFNYVRMFIAYDSENDSWLFNDGDGKPEEDHLRVFISYQKEADVPYANQ